MKISNDSICVKCPFCINRVSIVDYDEETGETDILYYRGECILGHQYTEKYCAKKIMIKIIDEATELIINIVSSIVDILVDIYNALDLIEKEEQTYPSQKNLPIRYKRVPRGDVRVHRVQFRRKGYHKHRRRGATWR